MDYDIVLASKSLYKIDLLKICSVNVISVINPSIDETVLYKESPRDFVKRMSENKAIFAKTQIKEQNCSDQIKETEAINTRIIILATDTIFSVGTRIMGKAQNIEDAKIFLQLMSGRRVNVFTSITVIDSFEKIKTKIIHTVLKIKRLTKEEISWYLNSNEWIGKTAGFSIQGKASVFVRFIRGNYYSVIGVPMYEIFCILQSSGAKLF